MPTIMVLGGGAFGRWLGYEGEAHVNGISVLIKRTPERSLSPSTMWGHSKKMAICEQESRSLPDTETANNLILDLPDSGTARSAFLLFKSHLVHGIFVIAVLVDQDTYWGPTPWWRQCQGCREKTSSYLCVAWIMFWFLCYLGKSDHHLQKVYSFSNWSPTFV